MEILYSAAFLNKRKTFKNKFYKDIYIYIYIYTKLAYIYEIDDTVFRLIEFFLPYDKNCEDDNINLGDFVNKLLQRKGGKKLQKECMSSRNKVLTFIPSIYSL